MGIKRLRTHPFWKYALNKYVIILVLFAVWILFLDANAWLTTQRDIDQQLRESEQNAEFYMRGIARDSARIARLNDSLGLEKFARERYLMKRENEEVYIIQHPDSVKNEEND
ncbi:FtsB family cell division protein [Nonlabens xiamenensis]|uniref:FtsB family cell division protein n=1 Tax=Nonlabens xiamenensis TaxID=2341043 RepID=UPI000F60A594|nr:septum formation initiator family protein [Nonlabens xiamenensis]